MTHGGDHRRIEVDPQADALRASNLSDAALTEGIQPGETVRLILEDTSSVPFEHIREKTVTAPSTTGEWTVSIGGFTKTINVTPTDPREIETNPDETIDVSSAEGMQGAETVESGVSERAEATAPDALTVAGVTPGTASSGPTPTLGNRLANLLGTAGSGDGGIPGVAVALLIALLLGAAALIGGN